MSIPRISESQILAAKAYEGLKTIMAQIDKARTLSDTDLLNEVESYVDTLKIRSHEHALLNELINRYERVMKIDRGEDFSEPTEKDLIEIQLIEAEIEANKDKVQYWVVRFRQVFVSKDNSLTSFEHAARYLNYEDAGAAAKVRLGSEIVEVVP